MMFFLLTIYASRGFVRVRKRPLVIISLFLLVSPLVYGFSVSHTGDIAGLVEPHDALVGYENTPAGHPDTLVGHPDLPAGHPDTLAVDTIRVEVLPEIMVSAFNKTRRLIDTPGSVSMIGTAVIEREQPLSILPLINQMSGVFAHSGTLNTSRITIRGVGARVPYATGRLRAYFNGIPLTNGSGISIVEHIDPSVIDRIEVVKGPASSAYGAGLGGTINIRSRQAAMRPPAITGSTETGSFGLFRNDMVLDMGTESFQGSLVYNRVRNDGYRENNSYKRDAVTSVLHWNPGTSTSVTGLLALSDMLGHIPSSIDSLLFHTEPASAAANWKRTRGYEDVMIMLAGVSATHRFHQGLSVDLALFSTMHNEMEMRPFDVLYEDRLSGGMRLSTSYSIPVDQASLQLMGGGELFLENFRYRNHENIGGLGEEGDMISNNREDIRYHNLFVQGDLEYARLNLSLGVNLHNTRVRYHDLFRAGQLDRSGNYRPGRIVSPRLSANYRYLPHQAVFVSISHGFSPAALSETLTPDGFINMDIRPEKSWSLEAGTRGNLWGHRFFYDLNLFQMFVTDLLVAERVGADEWVGRNAGASSHRGLELELQTYLVRKHVQAVQHAGWWSFAEVSLRNALTVNDLFFTDFIDRGQDYSGNLIPGIPSTVASSVVHARMAGGLYAGVTHRYTGTMAMNDLNNRFADPYQVVDVMAGYQRTLNRFLLDIHFRVNNLFDQHYASMILVNAPSFGGSLPRYFYPGLPRNYSTGVRLSFRL